MLADFGFARVATVTAMASTEGQGTLHFMAHELLLPNMFGLDKGLPSKEADIYAVGMTVYQVLTGRWPFFPKREIEIIHAVISGERPSKPENAGKIGITEAMWDLLEECWRRDRMARPDISRILRVFCDITGERNTIDSALGTTPLQLDVPGRRDSVDSQNCSLTTGSCE
jgi:serine/threonine protein kinase